MSATNVAIPVNDLSTGVSWNCGFLGLGGCSSIANQSYQDVVTVTGVTSSRSTVVATSQGLSGGAQTQNATTPAFAGNLSTGMYLPVANALASATASGTSYGGSLNTTFRSTAITSFTVGYSINAESASSGITGAQGISLGTFTVCR